MPENFSRYRLLHNSIFSPQKSLLPVLLFSIDRSDFYMSKKIEQQLEKIEQKKKELLKKKKATEKAEKERFAKKIGLKFIKDLKVSSFEEASKIIDEVRKLSSADAQQQQAQQRPAQQHFQQQQAQQHFQQQQTAQNAVRQQVVRPHNPTQ